MLGKKTKKINPQKMINQLKSLSIKLRVSNQLPMCFVLEIQRLNNDTNPLWIETLKDLTESSIRVKGFYKKHRELESQYNEMLDDARKEFIKKYGHI